MEGTLSNQCSIVKSCLPFLVDFIDEGASTSDKTMNELDKFSDNSKMTALTGLERNNDSTKSKQAIYDYLMQSCLALLVLPLGVSAVLEEAPQHRQVPGLGSDVDRGAAIAPGQVRVSTRLEKNLKNCNIQ